MSRNEWEKGTITLPASAVAPLKKILRDKTNAFHDEVLAEAKKLHKMVKTRSAAKYVTTIEGMHYGSDDKRVKNLTPARLAALQMLAWMGRNAAQGHGTIHVPTVADTEPFAPKVNNRTTSFMVIGAHGSSEAEITFTGPRTVEWETGDGNHAVDNAKAGALAEAFFAYLDRVQWTRGTGGYGVGNDEYNREADYADGGANYVTFTYGPIGEAQLAAQAGMTLAAWKKMKAESAARQRGFGNYRSNTSYSGYTGYSGYRGY